MNNYCNWTIPYAISLTNILLTIAIITMCLADNNDCTVLMIVNIVYLIYYITFAIIVVVLYLIYVKSIRRIIEIAFIIFLIYAVASIFYILITYVSVFVTSCHSNFILIFVSIGTAWQFFTMTFILMITFYLLYKTRKTNTVYPSK